MAQLVAMSGQAQCSFGTGAVPVRVTTNQMVLAEGKPAATIMDATTANVGPFGMCRTLTNPAVAAATAAAMGVLTPQPCVPVTVSWIPMHPKVLIGGKPCLTQDCKLLCAWAGQISITSPGQTKTTIS